MGNIKVLSLLALAYPLLAPAQYVVNCGNWDRNVPNGIPDSLLADTNANVKGDVFASNVRKICATGKGTSYCGSLPHPNDCEVKENRVNDGIYYFVELSREYDNKKSHDLKPCEEVMDKIWSQCIDGPFHKVTSGTVFYEGVTYNATIGNTPIDKSSKSMDNGDHTIAGGTQSDDQICMGEWQSVIDNLNKNFDDSIDVTKERAAGKFVDFSDISNGNNGDHLWWRITSSGGAFFVVGQSLENTIHLSAENSGSEQLLPFARSDFITFIQNRRDYYCTTGDKKLVVSPPTTGNHKTGLYQYCMADIDNYQGCSGSVEASHI